jgi:hypothetical protein
MSCYCGVSTFCEGAGGVHSLSGFPGLRIQHTFRTELARIVKDRKDKKKRQCNMLTFVSVCSGGRFFVHQSRFSAVDYRDCGLGRGEVMVKFTNVESTGVTQSHVVMIKDLLVLDYIKVFGGVYLLSVPLWTRRVLYLKTLLICLWAL